jgi:hypothetical protein
MYKITHRQLFKKGVLIADQKINLIVPTIEAIAKETANAQKRYKYRAGDYQIKMIFEPCRNETVKDCGAQLRLF